MAALRVDQLVQPAGQREEVLRQVGVLPGQVEERAITQVLPAVDRIQDRIVVLEEVPSSVPQR